MSPYRVIIADKENPAVRAVLSAMKSVDKETGEPVIYIIQKMNLTILDKLGGVDYEAIAYKQMSKVNSEIIGKYRIVKDGVRKYKVRKAGKRFTYDIGVTKFTQQACLAAAMEHFCQVHGVNIDTVL